MCRDKFAVAKKYSETLYKKERKMMKGNRWDDIKRFFDLNKIRDCNREKENLVKKIKNYKENSKTNNTIVTKIVLRSIITKILRNDSTYCFKVNVC